MYNTQDLNPEHGFNQLNALRDLNRLDGAERTGYDRFMVANEAVESCVALIDRFMPAQESVQPVAIRQPESTPSNVVDLEEYRQRRVMRHDARGALNQQPNTTISSEIQPQPEAVDPYAAHIATISDRVTEIRKQQEQQQREAA